MTTSLACSIHFLPAAFGLHPKTRRFSVLRQAVPFDGFFGNTTCIKHWYYFKEKSFSFFSRIVPLQCQGLPETDLHINKYSEI